MKSTLNKIMFHGTIAGVGLTGFFTEVIVMLATGIVTPIVIFAIAANAIAAGLNAFVAVKAIEDAMKEFEA